MKPAQPANTAHLEQTNEFSLRAFGGASFAACTALTSASSASVPYNPQCPRLSAIGPVGIYVKSTGTTPTFPFVSLADPGPGRTLELSLFDAAEGSLAVEILDPLGGRVQFTAEVLCQDGSANSDLSRA